MHSWRLARRAFPFAIVMAVIATLLVFGSAPNGPLQAAPAPEPAKVVERSVPEPETAPKANPGKPTPGTPTDGAPASKNPASGDRRVVAELPESSVATYSMVGVTWDPSPESDDLKVEVRWRETKGWTRWTELELDLENTATEGGRPGTEPQWVGSSDGVAVRVTSTHADRPAGLRVATIDPGASSDVQPVSFNTSTTGSTTAVQAAVSQPAIILRGAWGANTSGGCDSPIYGATTRGAVIHHTAGSNTYTKSQSASIVKATQAYHMNGRDWCDIGYNFLVDKYGQIFEGRRGGITKPVRGAHSGNGPVNQETMGVSLMGTFSTTAATDAMKTAVVNLVSWRFSAYKIPAKGTYSLGGKTLNRIAGHRNVVGTECPGEAVYRWLSAAGGLRDRVSQRLAGGTSEPAPAATEISKYAASLGPARTGAVVRAEWGNSTRRRANFTLMDILWEINSGVHYVANRFRIEYNRLGSHNGVLGFPTSSQRATTVSTVATQRFQKGTIYRVKTDTTYNGYGLYGPMAAKYRTLNEAAGSLGAPRTSVYLARPGFYRVKFIKGYMEHNVSTGGVQVVMAGATAPSANQLTVPSSREFTLRGHGYGHGIGMSQYGAQGAAIAGKTYAQILAHYYPGTALGTKTGNIRVLIGANTSSTVTVKAKSSLKFRKVATNDVTLLPTSAGGATIQQWRIIPLKADPTKSVLQYRTAAWYTYANKIWTGDGQIEAPRSTLTLVLPSGNTVAYRSIVRSALPSTGATTRRTVNVINIESYVRGVVAREMPSSWRAEALKAQSVAARTYGVRSMSASRYYDICDSTSCQVYGGVAAETSATNAAISGTAGRIVTYSGAPAFTQFSSSSGGYSEVGSQPYLKGQVDPYDDFSGNPVHDWTKLVKASTIESKYPAIGTLRTVSITKRNGLGDWGGRVTSVTFTGSSGSKTITGTDARWMLGLRSTWFRVN